MASISKIVNQNPSLFLPQPSKACFLVIFTLSQFTFTIILVYSTTALCFEDLLVSIKQSSLPTEVVSISPDLECFSYVAPQT